MLLKNILTFIFKLFLTFVKYLFVPPSIYLEGVFLFILKFSCLLKNKYYICESCGFKHRQQRDLFKPRNEST